MMVETLKDAAIVGVISSVVCLTAVAVGSFLAKKWRRK